MNPALGMPETNITWSPAEGGHHKNLYNFGVLLDCIKNFGDQYNPAWTPLKHDALTAQYKAAQQKMVAFELARAEYIDVANKREDAFDPLKEFSTKIVNALTASGASQATIKNISILDSKLQAPRLNLKTKAEKMDAASSAVANAETPLPVELMLNKVTQQSFNFQLAWFGNIVQLLSTQPDYKPSKRYLTVENLCAQLELMNTLNEQVIIAAAQLSNMRIARNHTLYAMGLGLVDTALAVKKYVKSIYGASSPEYKQLNSLAFKNLPGR